MRFLIGQLGSYGDCLYATTVAKQIKVDFPEAHLTWAIASLYKNVLDENPHVDEVWEIPYGSREEMLEGWSDFERWALARRERGDFDEIFLTQLSATNFNRFDGSLRTAIFRGYSRAITVPVSPVVRLSEQEVSNVARFAEQHRLKAMSHVVLFECAPKSSQSFVTSGLALDIARGVIRRVPGACFILSSDLKLEAPDAQLIDGSILSFRENAELIKYCSLLVGCSSGLSWLATSDWVDQPPMIQLLESDAFLSNSMITDAERSGLPVEEIIEFTECSPERIQECIIYVFDHGIRAAKSIFHSPVPMRFTTWKQMHDHLIDLGRYRKAVCFLTLNIRTHGTNPRFLSQLPAMMSKWCNIPITILNRLRVHLALRHRVRRLLGQFVR